MIDEFDYKEPNCALCDGKEFYNPDKNAPKGRIPVKRIIEKVDVLFDKNDLTEAGRLLEYWQNEAIALGDNEGELSIDNELIGFYRKTLNREKAFSVIEKALSLLDKLYDAPNLSSATVTLNIATAFKAFGEVEKSLFYYGKALEVYRERLDKYDERFAGLYNNMALALVDNGEFVKAREFYTEAIEILKKCDGKKDDLAITYINLAHLIEAETGDRKEIVDNLFSAYGILTDDTTPKNGYHAYVLEKCAPSFGHFGFERIQNELLNISKEIYERN